jgi:hypothetical protein
MTCFYYSQIEIPNPMERKWTTASDVLNHLLKNRGLRQYLMRAAAAAGPTEWKLAHLLHPLFKTPLILRDRYNDTEFCEEIREYLEEI